jgi:large subunit ribosomal protein L3
MSGIIGRKIGMTRIIDENGKMIPLTLVQCQPNKIIQIKTVEKDGVNAIVLGHEPKKRPTKNSKYQNISQFTVDKVEDFAVDQEITTETLSEKTHVKISATSKGKGFQGVIKRHNFSRGPETHGSRHHREPGSVGACAAPGRVLKGTKLPGQMGNVKVTRKSAELVYFDHSNHLVGIKGSVPGAKNNLVYIFA